KSDVALQRVHIERGHRQLVNAIAGERTILQWIGSVVCILQVFRRKAVGINNQRATFGEVWQVHFQSRWVHGYQYARLITWSLNVLAREVQLKPADAGQAACRRANLSREIGQR